MKKTLYFLYFTLIPLLGSSQWIGFNKAHNVACQTGPFNYTASGSFGKVFVIDRPGTYSDGYLMFGWGNLCHPDSCEHYTRVFTAKCNVYGDLMWWKRQDENRGDFFMRWGSIESSVVTENHGKDLVGILTSSTVLPILDDTLRYNSLCFFDSNADLLNEFVVDSPVAGPGYVFRTYSAIIEDPSDSSYVMLGMYRDSLSQSTFNSSLSKVDSLGQRQWELVFPAVYTTPSLYNALDGGYWCVVFSWGVPGGGRLTVIKVSNDGEEEARLTLDGPLELYKGAALHEYAPGKIRVFQQLPYPEGHPLAENYGARFFSRTAAYNPVTQNFAYDSEEVLSFSSAGLGLVNQAHALPDNSYLVVGWDTRILSEPDDMGVLAHQIQGFINKLDAAGNPLWLRYYTLYYDPEGDPEGHGRHYQQDSKLMDDGGVVVSGYIEQQWNDPNNGLDTPWLFKVDSLGCIEPGCQFVNVEELMVGQQETMKLFPNPVSTMATVVFEFENKSTLESYFNNSELVIIDALGREVNRLPIPFIGDTEKVMVDFSSYAPGVYTLHWVSNNTLLDSVTAVKE